MSYRQFTNQGCLPTSLMMLAGIKHTKARELKLLHDGFRQRREPYSLAMIEAFLGLNNIQIKLVVDNAWYAKQLTHLLSLNSLIIVHDRLTITFLRKRKNRYIVFIDCHEFGEYTHQPHFIVCTPYTSAKVIMHDPWTGENSVVTLKRLQRAMMSLKNYLKYCPLVIELFEDIDGARGDQG